MNPFYATREAVKLAGNIKGPGEHSRIDRILAARTDSINRWLGRHFYPLFETRLFDWPTVDNTPYQLLLNADLLEVIALDSAGIEINNFFPYPNSGPPYSRVEIDLAHGEAFNAGGSWQNQVAVEAVWGYCRDFVPVGDLVVALDNAELVIVVPDSSLVGVGDLLRIGTEYLIVVRSGLADVGTTLSAGMDGLESTRLLPLTDPTKVQVGELVTVDAERMLIEDIAGANAVVTRAEDGSVLAEHDAAAVIYAPRSLTVERGSVGSDAVLHLVSSPVERNVPPGLITELTIAEVLSTREQELHGYGRETGQGDGAFELRGIGLADLRKRVKTAYQRGPGSRKAAI